MLTRRRFMEVAALAAAGAALGTMGGCSGASPGAEVAEEGASVSGGAPAPSEAPAGTAAGADPATSGKAAALPAGALCVAEYAGNTVAVVDPAAGTVLQRIPVGANPASAVVADGCLYVGSSGGGTVTAVSVADPARITAIPVGNQPLGLCHDPTRGLLYVGDYFTSSIHGLDTSLQSLVSTVKLDACGYHNRTDPPDCCRIGPGAGRRTVALALAPEGDVLYAANYGTFDVARIDLATGTELEAFDGVVGPRQILVSGDGASLVLAGVGGEGEQQVSDLYGIDRATGKRVREVPVGLSVAGVALAPDGARGWALARDDGALVAFDAAWEEQKRVSVGVGADTLALSPDGTQLYVVNSAAGTLAVVDGETLAVERTIEGLAAPKAVAVVA